MDPLTLSILTTPFAAWLLISQYRKSKPFHRGYQTCKGSVKKLKPEIDKILASQDKSLKERIDEVKKFIYTYGFSQYIEERDQKITILKKRIDGLNYKFNENRGNFRDKCRQQGDQIRQDIAQLEEERTTKEEELSRVKRNDNSQDDKEGKRFSQYFMGRFIRKLNESFFSSIHNLETHILLYFYTFLIFLLLAGDYAITYFIFKDVLKIQFKNDERYIYLFSGLIALVFLILTEALISILEKRQEFKKYTHKLLILSIIIVGLILLTVYVLMVLLPWLGNTPQVLDSLLRLLFVPLIVAVSLSIWNVQKKQGFSFLFTPLKVFLLPILLICAYLFWILEIILQFIVGFFNHESNTVKLLSQETESLTRQINQKNELLSTQKLQAEGKDSIEIEKHKNLIEKIEREISLLELEKAELLSGCESGIVSEVRLTG